MEFPKRGEWVYNLNTWVTLGGIAVGLVATATGWGITYADMRNANVNLQAQISDINGRMDKEDVARKERVSSYQGQISIMQQQLGQIPQLQFQTARAIEASAENKKSIEDMNNKNGAKLDSLIDQISKLSTQVQVLGSKLEDMQGKSDHTIFPRLPIASK